MFLIGIVLSLVIQNDRYLILTAQLYDAKEMATAAKSKVDKMGQRVAQDRIRIIQQGVLLIRQNPFISPTYSKSRNVS